MWLYDYIRLYDYEQFILIFLNFTFYKRTMLKLFFVYILYLFIYFFFLLFSLWEIFLRISKKSRGNREENEFLNNARNSRNYVITRKNQVAEETLDQCIELREDYIEK